MSSRRSAPVPAAEASLPRLLTFAMVCAAAALLAAPLAAQVLVVDSQGRPVGSRGSTVDRRYTQIEPTKVELSKRPLDAHTRADLIRAITAEQGFAMRPLPRGHRGLTLVANGKLEPAGESYLNMVTANGIAAKPGDRVVITDIKFDHNKVILMFNGGPDAKHRFLSHISLGTDPYYTTPIVSDAGADPTGARLTLVFKDRIPELTGPQVKALLAPLISFDQKTPLQAFTDTLPPVLKNAILEHHVLVGMSTEMLMYTMGRPDRKMHEMEGQMPVDIWIYGHAPDPVQFVRINGNRVIRYEIAKVGEPPQIFDKDVVSAMMRDDGTPVIAPVNNTRTIAEGDVQRNPNLQAPAPPPSLRNPGETLPQDSDKSAGTLRPVQFPKQQKDDYPDASRLPRAPQPPDSAQPAADKAPDSKSTGDQAQKKQTAGKQQPAQSKDKPPAAPDQMPGSTQPD
ncbi:MAG: hypothetical protein ACLGSD_03250 [Acidobacteriota bacterium]